MSNENEQKGVEPYDVDALATEIIKKCRFRCGICDSYYKKENIIAFDVVRLRVFFKCDCELFGFPKIGIADYTVADRVIQSKNAGKLNLDKFLWMKEKEGSPIRVLREPMIYCPSCESWKTSYDAQKYIYENIPIIFCADCVTFCGLCAGYYPVKRSMSMKRQKPPFETLNLCPCCFERIRECKECYVLTDKRNLYDGRCKKCNRMQKVLLLARDPLSEI